MATLKENFLKGIENIGRTFPVRGKVKGTKMVLKSVNKLKPIKIKGAYKLWLWTKNNHTMN